MRNKISTLSYFVKRLKDNKYIVWKMFDSYNIGDPRKWTILVNPGFQSVYITCFINNETLQNQPVFMFDDGGAYISYRDNIKLQTDSMQVIINKLVSYGILGNSDLHVKKSLAADDRG